MIGQTAGYVEQSVRRQESLVTPITFDSAIGAGATVFYSGKADEFFLIRKVSVANTTGGAILFGLSVGANSWVAANSIAANTTVEIESVGGILIGTDDDISATGNGLRVFGWGIRVRGGDGWAL